MLNRCTSGRSPPCHFFVAFTELLRENKRMIDKAIRDLDRERMGLQNQEKKLILDIKKGAKEGQMDSTKILARSLIRNRQASGIKPILH